MAVIVSDWRRYARGVIDRALEAVPADADEKAVRKALSAVYPFGERQYHPYKMWLAEVKDAVRRRFPAPESKVETGWVVLLNDRYWLDYRCRWCGFAGCLMCGPERERFSLLLAHPEFLPLLRGLRAGGCHPGIVADWLDEHEFPEAAALFRAGG